MTMKVLSVNIVPFRSAYTSAPDNFAPKNTEKKQVKELVKVTPDFNINLPVKYKSTGIYKLDNGLDIYSYKMENGYKVNIVPMKNSPTVVKSYVNVGSLNETADIKGISHFLEHMAFNGTNGDNGHIELKQGDSFKEIDKLGGWANASTNYALTDYVNSTPALNNKDLETQIKVIAAMTEDLKLSEDMIKKEKGPVSSEINMILDNPETIGMDQTVRTLFNIKNPADELVGGSVNIIQNLTKQNVLDYYNKYYTPDNTNIVITGDVNPHEAIKLVAKNFTSKKIFSGNRYEEKITPISETVRKDFISDKTNSAVIFIGFAGPKNNDTKGKILYDIATSYIGSHDFGLAPELRKQNAFTEMNSERISTNRNANRFGFITASTGEKNCERTLSTIFNRLGNPKQIDENTLKRIKQRIKQENDDIFEQSVFVNDCIGKSVIDNDLSYVTEQNKIIDSITAEEVNNAVKEYFNIKKAAVTVIHPKNNDNSHNNLDKSTKTKINFKGKERLPIDTNDISEYKLKNNFDIGFYNTKSNNVNVSITLLNNIPYTKKAGVIEVLNEIYAQGMRGIRSEKFEEFKDTNNLSIGATAEFDGLGVIIRGDKDNYNLGLNAAIQLLYNPNITDDTLKLAIKNIKDKMLRSKIDSLFIQNQFDNFANPYRFTRQEILNNLDNISVDDVKELHNYMLKNSRGIVTANIPVNAEKEIKSNIIKAVGKMKEVEPNKFKTLDLYKQLPRAVVLTSANNNSQADISQVFRFKYNNTIKEKAVAPVMNSILSGSSIGLFDTLREKENLAYSVHSYITNNEDEGKLILNILTTTDNKDIGEIN